MPRTLGRCLIAPTACSRCLSLSKIPLCPACLLCVQHSSRASFPFPLRPPACCRGRPPPATALPMPPAHTYPPFPPLFHSYLILIQHQQRKLSVFFISSPPAAGKAKQRTAARAYPALAAHPLLAAYTHIHNWRLEAWHPTVATSDLCLTCARPPSPLLLRFAR